MLGAKAIRLLKSTAWCGRIANCQPGGRTGERNMFMEGFFGVLLSN